MDDRSVDRYGNKISVGDIVVYASGDSLHGGEVVYIDNDAPELIVKHETDGLIPLAGDASYIFDNLIVRE